MEEMTWNYRVLSRTTASGTETWLGIYEVYYDADGNPVNCSESEVSPYGETLEELLADLKKYAAAAEKPILRWEDFA